MSVFQIIGVAGFLTYIVSFSALQARVIDGNGTAYSVLNIVAAALVLVSLTEAFNLASALIQISWIAIGVAGMLWKARASFFKLGETRAQNLHPDIR